MPVDLLTPDDWLTGEMLQTDPRSSDALGNEWNSNISGLTVDTDRRCCITKKPVPTQQKRRKSLGQKVMGAFKKTGKDDPDDQKNTAKKSSNFAANQTHDEYDKEEANIPKASKAGNMGNESRTRKISKYVNPEPHSIIKLTPNDWLTEDMLQIASKNSDTDWNSNMSDLLREKDGCCCITRPNAATLQKHRESLKERKNDNFAQGNVPKRRVRTRVRKKRRVARPGPKINKGLPTLDEENNSGPKLVNHLTASEWLTGEMVQVEPNQSELKPVIQLTPNEWMTEDMLRIDSNAFQRGNEWNSNISGLSEENRGCCIAGPCASTPQKSRKSLRKNNFESSEGRMLQSFLGADNNNNEDDNDYFDNMGNELSTLKAKENNFGPKSIIKLTPNEWLTEDMLQIEQKYPDTLENEWNSNISGLSIENTGGCCITKSCAATPQNRRKSLRQKLLGAFKSKTSNFSNKSINFLTPDEWLAGEMLQQKYSDKFEKSDSNISGLSKGKDGGFGPTRSPAASVQSSRKSLGQKISEAFKGKKKDNSLNNPKPKSIIKLTPNEWLTEDMLQIDPKYSFENYALNEWNSNISGLSKENCTTKCCAPTPQNRRRSLRQRFSEAFKSMTSNRSRSFGPQMSEGFKREEKSSSFNENSEENSLSFMLDVAVNEYGDEKDDDETRREEEVVEEEEEVVEKEEEEGEEEEEEESFWNKNIEEDNLSLMLNGAVDQKSDEIDNDELKAKKLRKAGPMSNKLLTIKVKKSNLAPKSIVQLTPNEWLTEDMLHTNPKYSDIFEKGTSNEWVSNISALSNENEGCCCITTPNTPTSQNRRKSFGQRLSEVFRRKNKDCFVEENAEEDSFSPQLNVAENVEGDENDNEETMVEEPWEAHEVDSLHNEPSTKIVEEKNSAHNFINFLTPDEWLAGEMLQIEPKYSEKLKKSISKISEVSEEDDGCCCCFPRLCGGTSKNRRKSFGQTISEVFSRKKKDSFLEENDEEDAAKISLLDFDRSDNAGLDRSTSPEFQQAMANAIGKENVVFPSRSKQSLDDWRTHMLNIQVIYNGKGLSKVEKTWLGHQVTGLVNVLLNTENTSENFTMLDAALNALTPRARTNMANLSNESGIAQDTGLPKMGKQIGSQVTKLGGRIIDVGFRQHEVTVPDPASHAYCIPEPASGGRPISPLVHVTIDDVEKETDDAQFKSAGKRLFHPGDHAGNKKGNNAANIARTKQEQKNLSASSPQISGGKNVREKMVTTGKLSQNFARGQENKQHKDRAQHFNSAANKNELPEYDKILPKNNASFGPGHPNHGNPKRQQRSRTLTDFEGRKKSPNKETTKKQIKRTVWKPLQLKQDHIGFDQEKNKPRRRIIRRKVYRRTPDGQVHAVHQQKNDDVQKDDNFPRTPPTTNELKSGKDKKEFNEQNFDNKSPRFIREINPSGGERIRILKKIHPNAQKSGIHSLHGLEANSSKDRKTKEYQNAGNNLVRSSVKTNPNIINTQNNEVNLPHSYRETRHSRTRNKKKDSSIEHSSQELPHSPSEIKSPIKQLIKSHQPLPPLPHNVVRKSSRKPTDTTNREKELHVQFKDKPVDSRQTELNGIRTQRRDPSTQNVNHIMQNSKQNQQPRVITRHRQRLPSSAPSGNKASAPIMQGNQNVGQFRQSPVHLPMGQHVTAQQQRMLANSANGRIIRRRVPTTVPPLEVKRRVKSAGPRAASKSKIIPSELANHQKAVQARQKASSKNTGQKSSPLIRKVRVYVKDPNSSGRVVDAERLGEATGNRKHVEIGGGENGA